MRRLNKKICNVVEVCCIIKESNDGNIVNIMLRPLPTNSPNFGNFDFYFDGCEKWFYKVFIPFIGLDECHLKIKYGGQFLRVVDQHLRRIQVDIKLMFI